MIARLLSWVLLLGCSLAFAGFEGPSNTADFDAMWREIDAHYAYMDGRRGDWRRVRQAWRSKAAAARTHEDLVAALEGALATLRDDRVTALERTPRSARRVPVDLDLWPRWRDGMAVIEAVRFASDADVAGVRPGDIVTAIDGVQVARAVQRLLGRGEDSTSEDRQWALRHLLAGPWDGSVTLDLGGKEPRRVEVARSGKPAAAVPAVAARRIGESRDIGYLRLRNLADANAIEQLDGAIGALQGVRALIVDLRESLSESRPFTRAMLSRFATREGVWQQRRGLGGKLAADRITPGAKPLAGPLLVLVDRWTWGENEALAAGLVAVASARLVGTPMAGLHGETHETRLPNSGIVIAYPAEKVLLPDGTTREALRPHVEVDLSHPNGGPGDPILYQALKLLEK